MWEVYPKHIVDDQTHEEKSGDFEAWQANNRDERNAKADSNYFRGKIF